MCADIPCIGDRCYGPVQDDEILMIIPAIKLEQVVKGMKVSDPSASHRFSPYLGLNVPFPSEL
jgi:uncharacterized protein (DUF169 family)